MSEKPENHSIDKLTLSFNTQANRFYKMLRITATSKAVMTALAIVAVGFSLYNIYNKYQDDEGKSPHIAIIKITGTMGTGSETGDGTIIASAIRKAYDNPNVRAVLIEAESGGGNPSDAISIYRQLHSIHTPQDAIQITESGKSTSSNSLDKQYQSNSTILTEESEYQQVRDNVLAILKDGKGTFAKEDREKYKPVVVSVKSLCASACYYAAAGADAIYADGNALIGSIGVRMDHWDVSEVMKTIGVKNEPLIAGEFKDSLDPWYPMTPETKEFMKSQLLDKMHETFISDVELGRKGKILNHSDAQRLGLYSGRIWLTPAAIDYGLIDGEVTTTELRERLQKLYGTDKFKEYNEPRKNLRSALGLFVSLAKGMEQFTSLAEHYQSALPGATTPKLR
ncbi:S49 family peptidase [Photorhabdus heterorhabditis]|uniref:S49 family peptidase n=1 Tax=Photorhabdus heterorhabditis TaxID=880156 RepID=UPI001561B6ED|nr:S49 family peptidase [Photorhabdus heterorhabditis]NRN29011.1 S49 family peptidase [Photorhabdus heterorhabditis subsp. aluminescens]